MAIVHMASSYEEALERGSHVHINRGEAGYLHTTLRRYSDGVISTNLNPSISLDEQPKDGYEYTPVLWLYETHHGVCLFESERNGYNDSDFYMTFWDEEKQAPGVIEFASTRGWSYPCFASCADATPEVLARYEAWDRARREKARLDHEDWLRRQPAKGKTLKVVRGRKVPKGLVGLCIWLGRSAYGERVGIKTESGEVHWTALSNVEVVCA